MAPRHALLTSFRLSHRFYHFRGSNPVCRARGFGLGASKPGMPHADWRKPDADRAAPRLALVQAFPNLKGIIIPAGIGLPAAARALEPVAD